MWSHTGFLLTFTHFSSQIINSMYFGKLYRKQVTAAALIWLSIAACQPSRSDVFVEVVNPSLVQQLVRKADTVIGLVPDTALATTQPFWVRGQRLPISAAAKESVLWFDEMDRLTGLLEFSEGRLTDSIAFYPNGQRMFTLIINKTGKPEGPARYYYPDGRVKLDGRFSDGIQTGIWREFAPDGRLIIAHEYDRYGNQKR